MLPSSRRRSQPAMGTRLALLSPEESLLLSRARPNVLLEGPEPEVQAAVSELLPHLSRPLSIWPGHATSALPPEWEGTVIVQRVDRLNGQQQRALVAWLDAALGRVQIVAIASNPLFPLVERGSFLDVLYYRLNVVRVDVTGGMLA